MDIKAHEFGDHHQLSYSSVFFFFTVCFASTGDDKFGKIDAQNNYCADNFFCNLIRIMKVKTMYISSIWIRLILDYE